MTLENQLVSFEKYLQDKHAEQYQGLDDGMPDDFNYWVEGLSSDEWIEYATKWHNDFELDVGKIEKILDTFTYINYKQKKPKLMWEKDTRILIAKEIATNFKELIK